MNINLTTIGGIGHPIWSLWLSAHHGSVATRRLEGEPQASRALMAAGRVGSLGCETIIY